MSEFDDTQTVIPAWERTKLDQPYREENVLLEEEDFPYPDNKDNHYGNN